MLKKNNEGYEEALIKLPLIYTTTIIMELSLYYTCKLFFNSEKYNIKTIYKYLHKMIKYRNKKISKVLDTVDNNAEILKGRILSEEFKNKVLKYKNKVEEIDQLLYMRLKDNNSIVSLEPGTYKKQLLGQFKRDKKIGSLHEYEYFKNLEEQKKNKECKEIVKNYYEKFNELDIQIKKEISGQTFNENINKIILEIKLTSNLENKPRKLKEKINKI